MANFGQGLTAAGGGFTAMSQYNAGQATAMLQRANAGIAGAQAQSELQAGAENIGVKQQQVQRQIGAQQAATGASGIASYGSPLKVQEDTAMLGAQDVERMRINSLRKAWGFSVQQTGDQLRSELASKQGDASAVGTLITSGARAFGRYNPDIGP